MTTSINVDKRSVKQLLETGKNKRFIIPEYQRPYAWSDEQIQVLFDDLTEYTLNTTEDENNTYFLGTIVSYENDNKEQEIIDGQQRITSLLLLLRAIYTKLQSGGPETSFLKSQIEPTIWKQNPTTGVVNFDESIFTRSYSPAESLPLKLNETVSFLNRISFLLFPLFSRGASPPSINPPLYFIDVLCFS